MPVAFEASRRIGRITDKGYGEVSLYHDDRNAKG